MMCGQKRSRPEHPRLHLVEHQQRAVTAAQLLRAREIFVRRHANASLRLQRLDEECRILARLELRFQRRQIVEWNRPQYRPAKA